MQHPYDRLAPAITPAMISNHPEPTPNRRQRRAAAKGQERITMLKVDPYKQTVTPFVARVGGSNWAREAARLCKAQTIDWRVLLDIQTKRPVNEEAKHDLARRSANEPETVPLCVAGATNLERGLGMPAFRILGAQNTSGYALLFGRGENKGMVDVPVDAEWVLSRIKWVTAEEADADDLGTI